MKRHDNKGQSTVEFVLLLPVLLLILMAIIEFGFMFNAYLSITHASREGARLGSIGGTDSEIVAEVKSNLPTLIPENIAVTITPAATRQHGQDVSVSVSYSYPAMMPLINAVIGDSVNLNAETAMRVE